MKTILQKFFRNTKLLWQMGVLLAVFLGAASVVNSVLLYKNSMEMLLREKHWDTRRLAQSVAAEMEASATFEWLLSYWEENFSRMELAYNDSELMMKKFREFLQSSNADIYTLDAAALDSLSPENKKLYAEAEYLSWTSTFARMKSIYNFAFLSCYKPIPEEKIFYFLNAVGDYELERGRKIFMLGKEYPYPRETHPVCVRTWETGEMQNDMDATKTGYYHVYVPVRPKAYGKPVCIIDAQLGIHKVKAELLRNILHAEILSLLSFAACIFILFLLIRSVVIFPIAKLQAAMKVYQNDKQPEKVKESLNRFFGQNEIGLLAKDFASLSTELKDYAEQTAALAAKEERIRGELSLATTIQEGILPRTFPPFPERTEFDIYATMKAAKEVGGDFYDFFMVGENRIALVMADVSGKGVGAALFMMASRTLIKSYTLTGCGPAETLSRVNEEICAQNEAEMFVSVWLGIFDIKSGRMVCANAGHEFPAIKRAGGKFELFKDKHGFVVGGMSGIRYKEYELELKTGDAIFVYTDGVPEATNSQNEEGGCSLNVR